MEMILGAQLFTLREYTQTEKDLDFSLGKVAEMGYTTVPVSYTHLDVYKRQGVSGGIPVYRCESGDYHEGNH